MYHDFFGLTQAPFKITPDTRLFYSGGSRGEILAALVYAIESGEGITKLVGEVGSGKTMLCRMLELRLPDNVEIAYLANPSLEPDDILHAIALEIGMSIEPTANRVHVMQALHHKLLDKHAAGKQLVVFVEEAQSMPLDTLEEIRLLSNLETQQSKLLQIVLFGQPELDKNLDESGIRQLRERITHSFYLKPLTKEEIQKYVRFRLQAVGYRGPDMFEDDAYKQLARASLGLTRRVNILADKALLAAFAENTHNVSRRHVRVAIEDSELNTRRGAHWPRYAVAAGLCGVALALGGFFLAAPDSSVRDALRSGFDSVTGYIADSDAAPAGAERQAGPKLARAEQTTTTTGSTEPDAVAAEDETTGSPVDEAPATVSTEASAGASPAAEGGAGPTPGPDSQLVLSEPETSAGDLTAQTASATSLSPSGRESETAMTAAATEIGAKNVEAGAQPPDTQMVVAEAAPVQSPAASPQARDEREVVTEGELVAVSKTGPADSPAAALQMPDDQEVMTGAEAVVMAETAPVDSPAADPQMGDDQEAALDSSPAAPTVKVAVADAKVPGFVREEAPEGDTIEAVAGQDNRRRASPVSSSRLLVTQRLDAARTWLRGVNKNYYTIQLLATDARQEKRLEDLLHSWRKRGTIDRVYIYQTKVGDGIWYGVLYDDYETFAKARAALEGLPAEVKRYKPFIRNVRDLGSFG